MRQLTLARRASLKLCMSRNPKPPSLLDFTIVFHATRAIPRSPAFGSHQKCVRADWILLQRDCGSLKHCIVWFGIASSTDFRRVILPTGDKYLVAYLTVLCRILSTMEVNRSRTEPWFKICFSSDKLSWASFRFQTVYHSSSRPVQLGNPLL